MNDPAGVERAKKRVLPHAERAEPGQQPSRGAAPQHALVVKHGDHRQRQQGDDAEDVP
jgi:hypothetical protein